MTEVITPNRSRSFVFNGIKTVLQDPQEVERFKGDYIMTFSLLGVKNPEALVNELIVAMKRSSTIEDLYVFAQELWGAYLTKTGSTFMSHFPAMFSNRISLMMSQILPHLRELDTICDVGAGKGDLAQYIKQLGYSVDAYDVMVFPKTKIMFPVKQFDGASIPVADQAYDGVIVAYTLHHEENNERLLKEVCRIAKKRLIILETISEGNTEAEADADWCRTFMSDVLWNTLFNHLDTPVPGTYDTPEGWKRRIGRYGWKQTHFEDLGYDQPSIRDRHILMVFERD